jgi:hypothetical protein
MISRTQARSGSLLRHVFVYLLPLVWLGSTALVQAQGEQRSSSNRVKSKAEEKVITVWKVGNPYRGDTPNTTVPLDLQLRAEESGYNVNIESFPATGFAETYRKAFENNQEPDILAINNSKIIGLITTPRGSLAGTGSGEKIGQELVQVTESLSSLEGPERGWELLIRTSRNYEAARLLALQPPECNASRQGPSAPEELGSVAAPITQAYLERAALLHVFEDADRLHTGAASQRKPQEVFRFPVSPIDIHTAMAGELRFSETKVCGCWGNDHLAFVQTVSTYESARALGRLTVLLIFRNQQGQWQLLTASTDPISNTWFVEAIPKLAALLQKPWTADSKPMPAKLLSPEDGQRPEPLAGQRFGDFSWQPSPSPDVVAEIVEFAYKDDARLFVRLLSGDHPASEKISDGMLWTSSSLWQWRVWSISDAGAISFSETRSFRH